MIILAVEFAFSFYIAVYASMMCTFYNSSWDDYLKATSDFIEKLGDSSLKSVYTTIIDFYNFSIAEAILTWIIALPSISILLISLVD